jgi:hypothetical protein
VADRRARAPVATPRADRPTVAAEGLRSQDQAERLRSLEQADWADAKAWPSVPRTILARLRRLSSLKRQAFLMRATGRLALGAPSVVGACSIRLADPKRPFAQGHGQVLPADAGDPHLY